MNEYDYLAKARDKMDDKKYHQVISLCDEALKINKNLPKAYEYRGDAKYWLGQYDDAADDYSSLIDIEPKEAQHYLDRAWAYSCMDNNEAAIIDINKALEIKPNSSLYLYVKSRFEYNFGRFEEGIADATRAIEIKPTENKHIVRANCYMELEKYDLALSDLNTALEYNPESEWAYFRRGILYKRLECLELAEKDFKKVLELNPDDSSALTELGFIRIQTGKKDAMKYFNKAIKVNPDNFNYYSRVIAREKILKREYFLEKLKSGEFVNDDDSENTVFNEKQAKDDIKDLNKALLLDENDTYCLRLIIIRYNYLKQYENALKCCEVLKELEPENKKWYLSYAFCQYNTGMCKEAIEGIDAYLEMNEGNGDYFLYLTRGSANFELGKFQNAVIDYTKGIAIKETADLYYERGLANYKLKHYLQAYRDFKRALELNPEIESVSYAMPKLIKLFLKPKKNSPVGLNSIRTERK